MTKEKIMGLQDTMVRGRMILLQRLEKGPFLTPEQTKSVNTTLVAMDTVIGLLKQYISQLPLEKEEPQ